MVKETWEELITNVNQWRRQKGIDNIFAQYTKFIEEAGELAHELTRQHYSGQPTKDAFGDILVTVIILADMLDLDLRNCLADAWYVIKDRKGTKPEGGAFIKEGE